MKQFKFEVGKAYGEFGYIRIERRTRCYVWVNGTKFKVHTEQFENYETEYVLFGLYPGTMVQKRVYCH